MSEIQEPLLVSAMRKKPTGHVQHRPYFPDGTFMTGVFTGTFLRELEEWAAEIWQRAHDDHCERCWGNDPCPNPYRRKP